MRLLTQDFFTEPRVYNMLPGVEEAHQTLRGRSDFDTFLGEFAELACASAFEQVVGVFLLHRHYLLAEGQLMMESQGEVSGEAALVTSAQRERCGRGVEFAPSRLALRRSAGDEPVFLPLEYSRDAGVVRIFRALRSQPTFVSRVGELLERYSIADLLGLAIVARTHLVCPPGTAFLERPANGEYPASVVTVRAEVEVRKPRHLPTTWMPQIVNYCQPTCSPNHWCLGQPDGSHQQVPYHDAGPHREVPDT